MGGLFVEDSNGKLLVFSLPERVFFTGLFYAAQAI
jgi:hypothetical protein